MIVKVDDKSDILGIGWDLDSLTWDGAVYLFDKLFELVQRDENVSF